MHPAYFAMVMATGIVSIACAPARASRARGRALFWLNVGVYVVLWVLDARPRSSATRAASSPT